MEGRLIKGTGLQLPGVLDELFSYDGPLGAHFTPEGVSLHLWAPTAQVWCSCWKWLMVLPFIPALNIINSLCVLICAFK